MSPSRIKVSVHVSPICCSHREDERLINTKHARWWFILSTWKIFSNFYKELWLNNFRSCYRQEKKNKKKIHTDSKGNVTKNANFFTTSLKIKVKNKKWQWFRIHQIKWHCHACKRKHRKEIIFRVENDWKTTKEKVLSGSIATSNIFEKRFAKHIFELDSSKWFRTILSLLCILRIWWKETKYIKSEVNWSNNTKVCNLMSVKVKIKT